MYIQSQGKPGEATRKVRVPIENCNGMLLLLMIGTHSFCSVGALILIVSNWLHFWGGWRSLNAEKGMERDGGR